MTQADSPLSGTLGQRETLLRAPSSHRRRAVGLDGVRELDARARRLVARVELRRSPRVHPSRRALPSAAAATVRPARAQAARLRPRVLRALASSLGVLRISRRRAFVRARDRVGRGRVVRGRARALGRSPPPLPARRRTSEHARGAPRRARGGALAVVPRRRRRRVRARGPQPPTPQSRPAILRRGRRTTRDHRRASSAHPRALPSPLRRPSRPAPRPRGAPRRGMPRARGAPPRRRDAGRGGKRIYNRARPAVARRRRSRLASPSPSGTSRRSRRALGIPRGPEPGDRAPLIRGVRRDGRRRVADEAGVRVDARRRRRRRRRRARRRVRRRRRRRDDASSRRDARRVRRGGRDVRGARGGAEGAGEGADANADAAPPLARLRIVAERRSAASTGRRRRRAPEGWRRRVRSRRGSRTRRSRRWTRSTAGASGWTRSRRTRASTSSSPTGSACAGRRRRRTIARGGAATRERRLHKTLGRRG